MINVNTVQFVLMIMAAVVLAMVLLFAPLVLSKQLKWVITVLLIIALGLGCLMGFNELNLTIGQKQEPSMTTVINEHTTIPIMQTYCENDEWCAVTADDQKIVIPDVTVLSGKTLTVREIFVRKEWTFILPFYLEETEYEYVDEHTPTKKGFQKYE